MTDKRLGNTKTENPSESAAEQLPVGDLMKRITIDPQVCHGEPCIRGMRIMVSTIINSLKGGMTTQELLQHYPDLTTDDIKAATVYASLR
jgi:uncharacterized protein (DUF433 family)